MNLKTNIQNIWVKTDVTMDKQEKPTLESRDFNALYNNWWKV